MDVSLTLFKCQLSRTGHQGLTLIELLIVIALLGIIAGIAGPSFSALLHDQRQISQLNTLVGHLNYARSEAIKRGQWVVVCKSMNGITCTNSANWDSGWMVFTDIDRNRQRDADEPLLYQQQGNPDLEIGYAGFPSSNYVIYYPNGTSLGNGTFTTCDKRGAEYARAVILAKSGRLRLSRWAADNSPLFCGS